MALDDCSLSEIKNAWEQGLGVDLIEDWWVGALNSTHSSTICARLGLIQFKVFHRVRYSKARLSEIYGSYRLIFVSHLQLL